MVVGRLRRRTIVALLLFAACGETDECENLPPGFQLDIVVADTALANDIAFLLFTVRAEDRRFQERFAINDELEDGRSSIAIQVSSAPSTPFFLQVDVAALDIATSTLATARITTTAQPTGCNLFEVEF